MNPILLGEEVADGLKDLVKSSFETTSPAYRGMIDSFLADERNLLKGPWISVDLPFRPAASDAEPFPNVPLGYRAYRHQDLAFQRLCRPSPRSTLVATGTGSGKTESFLWPILDACRELKGQPGIKAIIIYPMNALASDQARRIAKAVHRIPALKGVRCGIYADAEPKPATDVMSEEDVITRRAEMLNNPPDILLTNYKMLDLLLLRGRDKRLWAKNDPDTLRYLVVDELHTFDGAQGADLALLIRRLKARLKTPNKHLACVGSSATLGSGPEAADRLVKYASDLFGEAFAADCVIREDRLKAQEYLGLIDYTTLPDPNSLRPALTAALSQTQAEAAGSIARLLFDELDPKSSYFDRRLPSDPEDGAWRLVLGAKLKQHVAFHRILEAMQTCGKAASLDDLVTTLSGARIFREGWSAQAIAALVEVVVVLTAWARSGTEERLSPLLNVRVQLWARELARMAAGVPTLGDDGTYLAPTLHHSDDLEDDALGQMLPIIHCRHCGTTGQLGRISTSDNSVGADLKTIYEDFFEGGQYLRFLYFEPIVRHKKGSGYGAVLTGYLHPKSLLAQWGPHSGRPRDAAGQPLTPVWIYDPVDGNRIDRTCPACGTPHGLQIVGLRSSRLSATLATTLFNSEHHEADRTVKPRVLTFSDSVQDAAQRAAVTEIRNVQTVIRKALYQAIVVSDDGKLSLSELISKSIDDVRTDMGEPDFVARFIARDQTWRDTYQKLSLNDEPPADRRLGDDVALRLGWEFFSDLTYRARTSQTLEAARLMLADVESDAVVLASRAVKDALRAEMGPDFDVDDDASYAFTWGILTQMRRGGAVSHPYVLAAANNGTLRGPGYFAAQSQLGVRKLGVLPTPNPRTNAAPRLPTLRTGLEGYDVVSRDKPTNWYRSWANRFFGKRSTLLAGLYSDLYACVFGALKTQTLLVDAGRDTDTSGISWLVKPERIEISDQFEHLGCTTCGRREIALAGALPAGKRACFRINCDGMLVVVDADDNLAAPSRFVEGLMKTRRNHRIVAREHTGILDADNRRSLEKSFISREESWQPNFISATPTLEMGIDIGDLSTVMLASMPPEEANYVQRIGRTGRRDGNSFNVTLISARPHDLQFWESPRTMLAGEITPPGVHLEAVAVLSRQAAAFALDRFIEASSDEIEYGKVNSALATLDRRLSAAFPLNWFEFLSDNGSLVADAFIGILPAETQARKDLCSDLKNFLEGDGENSLRYNVMAALDGARSERDDLLTMQKALDAERRRLQAASPPPDDLKDQLEQMSRRRAEISRTIRDTINDVDVLKFLTDRGILPNYAFPEEGVKLKSIIVKAQERPASGGAKDSDLVIREYVRSASQALSELAPFQTFYAEGREVTIDRIDLRAKDLSEWRFCPVCSHAEAEQTAGTHAVCPRCSSPMWADIGGRAETVALRSVIATSTEQKSAIRDLDSRTTRHYDRSIFPSYGDEDVSYAYAIPEATSLGPFGFEFVAQCEFRDVNFGPRTAGRGGRTVAGEQRQSRPFPICRECGKLQTDLQKEHGEHQASCPSDKGKQERASWLSQVYLMRRFTTEAIRIIVPVAGRADDDDNKSFVAAIELGLKKHFAGRVDHIKSAVVEERLTSGARVRNLYLYDAIPGGSGYLRQLAASRSSMFDVFRQAQTALNDCPCRDDATRNGCFRCVKSYRLQYGAGEPRRDRALQLVDAVLEQWDQLKAVDRAINIVLGAGLVESELERRFLDKLAETFGLKNLRPIVLDTGRRGFQLKISDQGEDLYWQIEPQIEVADRFLGAPKRRVDFLLTKASSTQKPIVIELDGWEHHAERIAEDIEARMGMLRTGRLEVWTLTWDDIEAPDDGLAEPPHPFQPGLAPPAVDGALATLWTHDKLTHLHVHQQGVKRLRTLRTIDSFLERLRTKDWRQKEASCLFAALLVGREGTPLLELESSSELPDEVISFLERGDAFGLARAPGTRVYIGAPKAPPSELVERSSEFRFVLVADMPEPPSARFESETARRTWRSFWRTFNILQDAPRLHVVFPDLTTLSPPSTSTGSLYEDVAEDMLWSVAADQLDTDMQRFLAAARAAGVSPPDMVGEDVMQGDKIVGLVEIGWRDAKVGVTYSMFECEGWMMLQASAPTAPEFVSTIAELVTALREAA